MGVVLPPLRNFDKKSIVDSPRHSYDSSTTAHPHCVPGTWYLVFPGGRDKVRVCKSSTTLMYRCYRRPNVDSICAQSGIVSTILSRPGSRPRSIRTASLPVVVVVVGGNSDVNHT